MDHIQTALSILGVFFSAECSASLAFFYGAGVEMMIVSLGREEMIWNWRGKITSEGKSIEIEIPSTLFHPIMSNVRSVTGWMNDSCDISPAQSTFIKTDPKVKHSLIPLFFSCVFFLIIQCWKREKQKKIINSWMIQDAISRRSGWGLGVRGKLSKKRKTYFANSMIRKRGNCLAHLIKLKCWQWF